MSPPPSDPRMAMMSYISLYLAFEIFCIRRHSALSSSILIYPAGPAGRGPWGRLSATWSSATASGLRPAARWRNGGRSRDFPPRPRPRPASPPDIRKRQERTWPDARQTHFSDVCSFAQLRKRGNESILTLPEFRKRRSVTLSAHFDVSRIVETWKCLGFGSFRRIENSQKVRLSRQRFRWKTPIPRIRKKYFAHRSSVTHDRSLVNDFLHPEFSWIGSFSAESTAMPDPYHWPLRDRKNQRFKIKW